MNNLDCLQVKGIEFQGRHGAYEDEFVLGQRFWVDVSLYGDFGLAAQTDELEDTVDYAQVCETVLQVCRVSSVRLIERLAAQISDALLDRFEVDKVSVKVSKKPYGVKGLPGIVSIMMTRNSRD